ncbi:MAG: hypothetical protein D6714_17825, partial [Bacteroidetes bacterium]
MSDKMHETDQQFTDRAWREMSKILDREMPVERPRRRPPVWWFWGGFAVVAGVLIACFFMRLEPAPVVPNAPAVAAPSESPADASVFWGEKSRRLSPQKPVENAGLPPFPAPPAASNNEKPGPVPAPVFELSDPVLPHPKTHPTDPEPRLP